MNLHALAPAVILSKARSLRPDGPNRGEESLRAPPGAAPFGFKGAVFDFSFVGGAARCARHLHRRAGPSLTLQISNSLFSKP
jgi:hypothetical protein